MRWDWVGWGEMYERLFVLSNYFLHCLPATPCLPLPLPRQALGEVMSKGVWGRVVEGEGSPLIGCGV